MMIRWWEHSAKGVTDGRTDGQTDRQTDRKYHSLSCLVAAKKTNGAVCVSITLISLYRSEVHKLFKIWVVACELKKGWCPFCSSTYNHSTPQLKNDGSHFKDQAPVPLSIFRSNSKFDENSERSSFEYTRPITTIFCTRHDSETVVTCAKYLCDRRRMFYIRVFWIFIEFRIRSKYA